MADSEHFHSNQRQWKIVYVAVSNRWKGPPQQPNFQWNFGIFLLSVAPTKTSWKMPKEHHKISWGQHGFWFYSEKIKFPLLDPFFGLFLLGGGGGRRGLKKISRVGSILKVPLSKEPILLLCTQWGLETRSTPKHVRNRTGWIFCSVIWRVSYMLKMIFSVHEGQGKSIAENLMHALASVLFLDLKCSVRKTLNTHYRAFPS